LGGAGQDAGTTLVQDGDGDLAGVAVGRGGARRAGLQAHLAGLAGGRFPVLGLALALGRGAVVAGGQQEEGGEGGGDGDGQGAHEESPGFSGGADRSSRIRNATRPPPRVSHPTGPREPAPAPSIPRRTRPARYEPSPVVGSPVGRLPPSALV